jgi:apolipoprotein N-acyltransferase
MARERRFRIFPSWQNALLALLAAGLLILAFPDFEWWWTAWFALVPLMWAVEREGKAMPSFMLGWVFGTTFFFGTCWWLTYAPIHYAGVPPWLAYLLIFVACLLSGIFPAIFAAILARLLQRFGSWAFLAAPFGWVFTEFARYWLTGNNWNAVGYSQAFTKTTARFAEYGGVLFVSAVCIFPTAILLVWLSRLTRYFLPGFAIILLVLATDVNTIGELRYLNIFEQHTIFDGLPSPVATLIAVQPNVPMSGMDAGRLNEYRRRQFVAAEEPIRAGRSWQTVAVLPESPMNFAYNDDREFQQYVRDFTTRNNVSLLFNSAEPDRETGKYFNSAVMVGPDGRKVAEYDKIYLLPFGEAVPFPFEGLMPAVVGSFAYGKNYSLVPVGDAKAGVMICFESHFGQLGREQVRQGADVIIEMTNDGYLGPTPVLRQHLANAVFRAVETNRPVLRVTNVGITAYVTPTGQVLDATQPYTEDTRVWSVSKSDGSQTFYVKYGDWFAWLSTVVTAGLVAISFRRRREVAEARTE